MLIKRTRSRDLSQFIFHEWTSLEPRTWYIEYFSVDCQANELCTILCCCYIGELQHPLIIYPRFRLSPKTCDNVLYCIVIIEWSLCFLSGGHKEMSSICISWPIAPSHMGPNAGEGGGVAVAGLRQWVQLCTWSPNKFWRSNSIFNLCSLVLFITGRHCFFKHWLRTAESMVNDTRIHFLQRIWNKFEKFSYSKCGSDE